MSIPPPFNMNFTDGWYPPYPSLPPPVQLGYPTILPPLQPEDPIFLSTLQNWTSQSRIQSPPSKSQTNQAQTQARALLPQHPRLTPQSQPTTQTSYGYTWLSKRMSHSRSPTPSKKNPQLRGSSARWRCLTTPSAWLKLIWILYRRRMGRFRLHRISIVRWGILLPLCWWLVRWRIWWKLIGMMRKAWGSCRREWKPWRNSLWTWTPCRSEILEALELWLCFWLFCDVSVGCSFGACLLYELW